MKKIVKGFTLIELLVVIGIIALLATVGMASYRSVNQRSRDSKRQADLEQVRAALEQYRTDEGCYAPYAINPLTGLCASSTAADWTNMTTALGATYLTKVPSDPLLGNTAYGYYSDGKVYEIGAKLESNPPTNCSSTSGMDSTHNYCVKNP